MKTLGLIRRFPPAQFSSPTGGQETRGSAAKKHSGLLHPMG
jgi:hypothetical protein